MADVCAASTFTIDPSIVSANPLIYTCFDPPMIENLSTTKVSQSNPYIPDNATLLSTCGSSFKFDIRWANENDITWDNRFDFDASVDPAVFAI